MDGDDFQLLLCAVAGMQNALKSAGCDRGAARVQLTERDMRALECAIQASPSFRYMRMDNGGPETKWRNFELCGVKFGIAP